MIAIGLIGAGSMGSLHARVISQSPQARLAFVADPDQSAGERLADRHGVPWLKNLESFGDCDALVVAAPTATHFELAARSLQEGIPTLVEKPLSDVLSQTRTIIDTARSNGVPLTCGFVERFNPAVVTALGIVDDPIYIRSTRHSPYAPRVRTGVGHDLLVHDVDLAMRFSRSRPAGASSTFAFVHPDSEEGCEDIAELRLSFDSGLLASLSASRVSQYKIRLLAVATLEILVEVDLLRQGITVYRHVGSAPMDEAGPGYRQETIIDLPVIQRGKEPLAGQLDHFVDLIEGTADLNAELDTLLDPHRAIGAAQRSASLGGAGVALSSMTD